MTSITAATTSNKEMRLFDSSKSKGFYSSSNDENGPHEITAANVSDLIEHIDTFIFDADGVLWLGESALHGSADFLRLLINEGKRVIVLTNNATKSRAAYAKKLRRIGFPESLDQNHIVNPAAVAADLLSRAGLGHRKVYVIGSRGICDELDAVGVKYFGCGTDDLTEKETRSDSGAFMFDFQLDVKPSDVGAVLVGYEKHFNYVKLMRASNYVARSKECLFLATNEDETCPGPDANLIIPDAGPIVSAVSVASNRRPIVMGKPGNAAFDYITRRFRVNPKRTLMVGDRTNTDILFGKRHGLRTMLVLSGCHSWSEIRQNQAEDRFDQVPDFVAKSLGALID